MNSLKRKRTPSPGRESRRRPRYHSPSARPCVLGSHSSSPPQQAHDTLDAEEERPFGFKILYEPVGLSATIDIIAIHSLNGHREETWTDNGVGRRRLWLRDLLPGTIPDARIVSYGYDAVIDGPSQQTISGHAKDFVVRLTYFRMEPLAVKRPMIFIAHGTGGIILQLALLEAFRAHEQHLPHQEDLKLSTFGIIFLGTPHQGLSLSSFNSTFRLGIETARDLSNPLRPNSEYLQDLVNMFTPIRCYLDIKFIHETRPEPGQTHLTVPRSSAALSGAQNIQVLGMNRHHLALTKFTSEQDGDYQALAGMLQTMVREAPSKVVAHWETRSLGLQANRGNDALRRVHPGHYVEASPISPDDLPRSEESRPPGLRESESNFPIIPIHSMQAFGGIVTEVKNRYHLHNARIVGCHRNIQTNVALVKVFRGPGAIDRYKAALEFAETCILHPTLPQVIGRSPNNANVPYVLYDGAYSHSTSMIFAKALQMGPSRSMLLGHTMIHDVASALSYLVESGMPVTSLGSNSFELLLKENDEGLVLSFDPPERVELDHDDGALTNLSLSMSDSNTNSLVLCQELCQRTLNSANELLYGSTLLENTDFDDEAYPDISGSHITVVDDQDPILLDGDAHDPFRQPLDSSLTGETSTIQAPTSAPKAKRPPRRQYSWKTGHDSNLDATVRILSLSQIAIEFSHALDRYRLDSAAHQTRRRRPVTNIIPHPCPGYQREEITLSTRVQDIAVFASDIPLIHEVCPVCRKPVVDEILHCHCGITDYDGSEVVKCTHCATWQHRLCVAPLRSAHICYSCTRADTGQIDAQSGMGVNAIINAGRLDNSGQSTGYRAAPNTQATAGSQPLPSTPSYVPSLSHGLLTPYQMYDPQTAPSTLNVSASFLASPFVSDWGPVTQLSNSQGTQIPPNLSAQMQKLIQLQEQYSQQRPGFTEPHPTPQALPNMRPTQPSEELFRPTTPSLIWQGRLSWTGTGNDGLTWDSSVAVMASLAGNQQQRGQVDHRAETWPRIIGLVSSGKTVLPSEFVTWATHTRPIMVMIRPSPSVPDSKRNERQYQTLVDLLVMKKVYAVGRWMLPSALFGDAAILFPMNGGIMAAVSPLHGFSQLPGQSNHLLNTMPTADLTTTSTTGMVRGDSLSTTGSLPQGLDPSTVHDVLKRKILALPASQQYKAWESVVRLQQQKRAALAGRRWPDFY